MILRHTINIVFDGSSSFICCVVGLCSMSVVLPLSDEDSFVPIKRLGLSGKSGISPTWELKVPNSYFRCRRGQTNYSSEFCHHHQASEDQSKATGVFRVFRHDDGRNSVLSNSSFTGTPIIVSKFTT